MLLHPAHVGIDTDATFAGVADVGPPGVPISSPDAPFFR